MPFSAISAIELKILENKNSAKNYFSLYDLDPVYKVPDEFETGLKFEKHGSGRISDPLTGRIRVKQAKKDELKTGPKSPAN